MIEKIIYFSAVKFISLEGKQSFCRKLSFDNFIDMQKDSPGLGLKGQEGLFISSSFETIKALALKLQSKSYVKVFMMTIPLSIIFSRLRSM